MFDQDYSRRFIVGTVARLRPGRPSIALIRADTQDYMIYRSDTERSDTGYVYALGEMRSDQFGKNDRQIASRLNRETAMF